MTGEGSRPRGLVRAAGGVVWRPAAHASDDGGVEVLLIHRIVHDDWGWPKGKAEATDADAEATAWREVFEETGLRCQLGPSLGSISYQANGRPKVVRYWAMEPVAGAFAPNNEVDRVEWLPPEEARTRLSYEVDHEILDRFVAEVGRGPGRG